MTPEIRNLRSRARALTVICALTCNTVLAVAQDTPMPPQTQTAPAAAAIAPPSHSKRDLATARNAYLSGARLLERRELESAEKQFAKALQLDPGNPDYAVAVTLAREHRVTDLVQKAGKARLLGQDSEAGSLLAEAKALDPQNDILLQHFDPAPLASSLNTANRPWITEGPELAGPIELAPAGTTHSFTLHSDVQSVVRDVMSAYGIRVVLDESVAHQDIRFSIPDVSYDQASSILLRMARLMAVPLDAHAVLVAKDTPENRLRFERQLQETIYVPGMTPDQMGELGNVVRNIFDVKQATVQNSSGNLVIRAPEPTLKAINLTFADLIDGGSEVMIELKLYAVDTTRMREIGLSLPQQIGLYNVESEATNLVNANQALVNQGIAQGLIKATDSNITIALALIASGLVQSSLLTSTIGFFGGGLTQTGVTLNSGAKFSLALNSSDTRALDYIQVRVGDRQTATFRAGTRYPITTSTYTSGGTSALPASLAGVNVNGVSASSLLSQFLGNTTAVTVPQIQYEDLGVTLKAVPKVQKSGDVSMTLDLKIEALAGNALNNIPILASRQLTSNVTVRDGETALLLSSLSRTESAAVSGLPGLGELPGFQSVTADRNGRRDTSELVLLITPHIVRRRSPTMAGPEITFTVPPVSN